MSRRERHSRLVEWARLVDEEVPESALEEADRGGRPAEGDPWIDDAREQD